jgi:hypothetical protein
MRTEIKPNGDGTFTLFVNGLAGVREESYAVCWNVQCALHNPTMDFGECGEVADNIRRFF